MVLQIEKLADVVEACAAFRQCHTAAKCPLPPEFEDIGHSVPVTQNCLYRWIEEQLSDTVLHEQPERHHGESNDVTASTHVLSSSVSGS